MCTQVDLFDKGVSVALTLHPLTTVSPSEEEVLALRAQIAQNIGDALPQLEEYLASLRKHEELLARDEAAYVRSFEEAAKEPPTLQQLQQKVEAQRAERAALDAELPSSVVLGTFAVQQAPLKEALLAKFDKTAELLMIVICERGKAKAAEVSTAFAEMHDPPHLPRISPASRPHLGCLSAGVDGLRRDVRPAAGAAQGHREAHRAERVPRAGDALGRGALPHLMALMAS